MSTAGAQRLRLRGVSSHARFLQPHLPPVLPVAEDGDPPHHGWARPPLAWELLTAPLEACGAGGWVQPCRAGLTAVLLSAPGGCRCEGRCRSSVLPQAAVRPKHCHGGFVPDQPAGSPLEPGGGEAGESGKVIAESLPASRCPIPTWSPSHGRLWTGPTACLAPWSTCSWPTPTAFPRMTGLGGRPVCGAGGQL